VLQERSRLCVHTRDAADRLRRRTYVKFTSARTLESDRTRVICLDVARRLPVQPTTRTTYAFTPVFFHTLYIVVHRYLKSVQSFCSKWRRFIRDNSNEDGDSELLIHSCVSLHSTYFACILFHQFAVSGMVLSFWLPFTPCCITSDLEFCPIVHFLGVFYNCVLCFNVLCWPFGIFNNEDDDD